MFGKKNRINKHQQDQRRLFSDELCYYEKQLANLTRNSDQMTNTTMILLCTSIDISHRACKVLASVPTRIILERDTREHYMSYIAKAEALFDIYRAFKVSKRYTDAYDAVYNQTQKADKCIDEYHDKLFEAVGTESTITEVEE